MPKARTKHVCQHCGHQESRWLGRCPACDTWNSLVEERGIPVSGGARPPASIEPLECLPADQPARSSGQAELDRVLGGGVYPGAVVLVGGDPGVGKSTLLLQLACCLGTDQPVLYVAGEESPGQVGARAKRLGAAKGQVAVLPDAEVAGIEAAAASLNPALIVVDSIQTAHLADLPSAPGSVIQVRESAARLVRLAKQTGTAVFIVGHVTKEGSLAGPRVIEHMVDTVLYFEGERYDSYRILRAVKNRFGATNEIGVFRMTAGGLSEVPNASEVFLAERPAGVTGSCVAACLEGSRPLLVEVQALVAPTSFGMPRRMATGYDYNRACLILAVLERRVGLGLGAQDVYLKVVGGLRVEDPACDLAVAVSVASSLRERPVDHRTVVLGEVGLAGEVRASGRVEDRLREAAKLGFTTAVVPATACGQGKLKFDGLKVIGVHDVGKAIEAALEG